MPVCFNAQSDAALIFAREIATLTNDIISCIHILDEKDRDPQQSLKNEVKTKGRLDAELSLSQKVNLILNERPQTEYEIMVSSGDFSQKIIEKASDLNVRFIVMGKSNPGGKNARVPDQNTKEIIVKSQVPVILISKQNSFKRINLILPLDLLRPNITQINCAIETALKLRARVIALGLISKDLSELTPMLNRRLKDIEMLLDDINIPCEPHLLMTGAKLLDEVISFSETVDSGVILLLTKQEKDPHSLSIRSEEKEIIAKSNVPVLCFNPKSAGAWSAEKSSFINKTNPLAWFLLKGHVMNYNKEI